jgi:PAS domain S-box-containing protein
MDLAKDRIKLLYGGRFLACLILGAGAVILAFIINPSVLKWIIPVILVEVFLNQPFVLQRLKLKIRAINQIRINLHLDIILGTICLHFYGGYQAGIILSVYLLAMLYAYMAISPKDGLFVTITIIVAYYLMFHLESQGIINQYPALMDIESEIIKPLILFLIILVLLMIPSYVGYNLYKMILSQEKEIRGAIDRYQRLFDEVWEALILVDPDGAIGEVNPGAAKLLHRDQQEIVGKMFTEILSPESADDFAVIMENVSTGEQVTGSSLRLYLPDGGERIVEVNAYPYGRDPEPPGIFVLLRDITEQRLMEKELKRYSEELEIRVEQRTAELEESWERYERIFEKAAVPLAWLDPRGVLQSANRYFYKLTGLEKKIEGELPLVDILAKSEDREKVAEYLVLHRKGYEAPERLELPVKHAKGDVFWTEWFVRFEALTDQLLVSIIDVTERKKAEQGLKESEEKYRSLVDTSPDAITLIDFEEARIVMVNRQALKVFGFESEEEIIGRPSLDYIAPEDRGNAAEELMAMLETGNVFNGEYTLLKKDGTPFPGEISASVVRDAEGRPKFSVAVTRDITQRKRIETALRESEERYRSLFEQSMDVIYITTREGAFVDINPQAEELLGYTREELLGMDVREIYADPADRDRFKTEVEQKGSVRDYEVRFKKKNGEVIDCLLTATVRRAEDGRILGYQGIVRDITLQKQAEQALKESEERYRVLVDTSPDAISMVGLDGDLIMLNQRALEMLGVEKEEELAGKNAFDFIIPEDHDRAMRSMQEAVEDRKVTNIEVSLVRKDRSLFPADVTSSLVMGADNEPKAIISVARDVSDRRWVEDELHKYRESLEEQVEERAAELRESEERYRALFDRSLDCIYIHDFEGNFMDANPAALDLLGYTREEIPSLNFASLLSEDQISKAIEATEDVKKAGYLGKIFEFKLKRKDNEYVQIETVASVIYREGNPYAIQGVARDITERKQAEEALRESEEKYRTLFESAPEVIMIIGLDGTVLDYNSETSLIADLPREQIIGKNFSEVGVIREKDIPKYMEIFSRISGEEKPPPMEIEFMPQGSELRWVEVFPAPLKKNGEVYAFQLIIRDITERKLAEQALRESEERYRLHFENVSDVIFSIDREYIVTSVSPSVEAHLGYRPEEVVGRPIAELNILGPEYLEQAYSEMKQVFAGKEVGEAEAEFITKDGTNKFASIRSGSIIKDGEIVQVLSVARDITERKCAEAELEKYREHLEEQVEERTAELREEISERRHTENALRESEGRWRSLVENIPDIIITVDREGTILALNRTVPGFTVKDTIGTKVYDYTPPEQHKILRTSIKRVFKTGKPEYYEILGAGPEGPDTSWYEARVVPVKRDNQVVSLTIISTDITERKKAEKALRKSEERYRLLAENATDVIWTTDMNLATTYISPSVEQQRGFTVEEALTQTPKDILTPESYEIVVKTMAEELALEKKKKKDLHRIRTLEVEQVRKDGSTIWTEMKATFLRDEKGKAIGVLGVSRDITERRRAEEAVHESEEKFRSIIENSPDYIATVDREGKILFLNRTLGKIKTDEVVGKSIYDRLPEKFHEAARSTLDKVFESGESVDMEIFTVMNRWVECRVVPLKSGDRIELLMTIASDITERKESEAARRKMQEQLLKTEQMAAVGQMASGVVHEMNSPLTAISYYTQALEKLERLKKQDREKVQLIQESADRIQKLLARIVNYTSTQKAEFRKVNINDTIRQVLDAISHEMEMRPNIEVKTRLTKKIKALNGSPELLFDLVSNLIINALQAIDEDGGKVTVSTRMKNGQVEIMVKDDGAGIPETDLPNIFAPFFSHRKDEKGTGLGLAIVKRVAELHGGEVEVESNPDGGSVFRVKLPLVNKKRS